jgi:hypothetical protein
MELSMSRQQFCHIYKYCLKMWGLLRSMSTLWSCYVHMLADVISGSHMHDYDGDTVSKMVDSSFDRHSTIILWLP